jgi:hypothetical protein
MFPGVVIPASSLRRKLEEASRAAERAETPAA